MDFRILLIAALVTVGHSQPDPGTEATCPPNLEIGICVVGEDACTSDSQCPGSQKCCSQGCGLACVDAIERPPFCTVALCPVGTRCDNERRECLTMEPGDCTTNCEMACEFGMVRDENGCEICECMDDPCMTVRCSMGHHCEAQRQRCDSNTRCGTGWAGVCVMDADCPDLDCLDEARERCERAGQDLRYEGNCATCDCEETNPCHLIDCAPGSDCNPSNGNCEPVTTGCEPLTCDLACDHGFRLDERGCDVCDCRMDPCATVRCGFNTVCVTRRIDVQCIRAPCPPQYQTSCVDPAPRAGMCPVRQSMRPCTDMNPVSECTYDSQCRDNLKCCTDSVCGAMLCMEPEINCPAISCSERISCSHGYALDDLGCPTCNCLPEPDFCTRATCPTGTTCDNVRMECVAVEPNACAAVSCFVGTTCNPATGVCEPITCDPVCEMYCEFGLDIDPNTGCEVCSCRMDPCSRVRCGFNSVCVTRRIDVQCIRAPCPSHYETSCVDPTPKSGTCPVEYSRRMCTDPNAVSECTYDSQCRRDMKCCHDNVCGVERCMEPEVVCPAIRCSQRCPAGTVDDPNGCPTCQCRDPCQTRRCPRNTQCEVTSQGRALCRARPSAAQNCPLASIPDTIYDLLGRFMPISHSCTADADCTGSQKCCDSFRGRACTSRLTSREPMDLSNIFRIFLGSFGSSRGFGGVAGR